MNTRAYPHQLVDVEDKWSLAKVDGHVRLWPLHPDRRIDIDIFEIAESGPCCRQYLTS